MRRGQPQIEDLTQWLEWATDSLCASARARISEEITCHYESAFQDALQEGATEDEAQRAAVAALGDPKKARRAFRAAHLTERQAKALRRLMGSVVTEQDTWRSWEDWKVLGGLGALRIWAWVGYRHRTMPAQFCLLTALLVVALLIDTRLVPWLWRSGLKRRAVLWLLCNRVLMNLAICVAMVKGHHGELVRPGELLLVASMMGMVNLAIYRPSLLLKLLRPSTAIDPSDIDGNGLHA